MTTTDNESFFREVEEDVRRKRLEEIWKRYGGLLISGAVTVVLTTAGLTYYTNSQQARFEEATGSLASVLQNLKEDNGAEIQKNLAELAPTLPEGHAVIAQLFSAAAKGKPELGEAALKTLSEDGKAPALYRDLATLLWVQRQLDSGDPAMLRSKLDPLMAAGQPWRYSAREAAALLALRTGDRNAARDLFEQLKTDTAAPSALRERAERIAQSLN